MSAKKYAATIFIGRFQPFHNGHLRTIRIALTYAPQLIIVIGSYRMAPSLREPWSAEERIAMIKTVLTAQELKKIAFVCVRNRFYNEDSWQTNVRYEVLNKLNSIGKIAIIGHEKDRTSYYLKTFPEWDFIETGNYQDINSTDFRIEFFGNHKCGTYQNNIPTNISTCLQQYRKTPAFKHMQQEFSVLSKAKKSTQPRTIEKTLLVCGKYLLFYQRQQHPGLTLYALPEHTQAFKHLFKAQYVQEAQFNSPLEPVITKVFFYKIPEKEFAALLPKIHGDFLSWMLIDDVYLNENKMYADNFQIISWFLNSF